MADEDLLACEPWATADDVFGLGSKYAAADSYLLADALVIATDVLYLATGRIFPGRCVDVVRPCSRFGSAPVAAYHGERLADVPGWWTYDYGWGTCGCAGEPRTGCCGGRSRVRLGHYPIVSVEEVVVDGEILDPSLYWIEDDRWLVRLPDPDGTIRSWPCCQRLDLPTTEADTFGVTLTYGERPPRAGVIGAAQYAGEIALDLAGSKDCSLGQKVRSYTRQQVNVQVTDVPDSVVDELPRLARLFVRSINPKDVRRPPTVWSPDVGAPVARTKPPQPPT